METIRKRANAGTLGKFLAAALIGLGVGTLLSPDPVAVPLVGTVPGVAVGGVGLVAGGLLYAQMPNCGCSGDCDCS